MRRGVHAAFSRALTTTVELREVRYCCAPCLAVVLLQEERFLRTVVFPFVLPRATVGDAQVWPSSLSGFLLTFQRAISVLCCFEMCQTLSRWPRYQLLCMMPSCLRLSRL